MQRPLAITSIALAALTLGASGGAATYAALAPTQERTIVRRVAVPSSEPASETSALSVNDIYRRAYRGVVDITVTAMQDTPFGGRQTGRAEGSGFVYDGAGHVVTNQHVVDGARSISVRFWNGATYTGRVVGSDPSTDLAVVKVDAPASLLHPLTLGDSAKLAVGDGVVAIGSPFGLAETVTSGIVSALHRQMTSPNNFTIDDSIQTDASINHGNSGGPLLDLAGHVVGVNAQIESDSGGSDGVGFAIPANTVGEVVSQLVAGKTVAHAYLGVSIADSSSPQGARLTQVVSGTPAAKAGLRTGDVIVRLGGTSVASTDDLSRVIDGKKPGDSIGVTFVRGGKQHTVTVKLGTRPS
jgi:putative serine protease PepD